MIAIVILLAVGPARMPTMMRAVGRAMREFRKATSELRAQTGIDELMREEINPLRSGPKSRAKAKPLVPITDDIEAAERPEGGVDVDWERRHGAGAPKRPAGTDA
jgi:TatA/E family protein of Tat protein translocase